MPNDEIIRGNLQTSVPPTASTANAFSSINNSVSPQHNQSFNLPHKKGFTISTPLGALIDGVFGLVSDGFNYTLNKKATERANKIARENATIDYQRQIGLMDRQQQYNSIENQVKDMKQAGLSPAMALGQISEQSAMGSSSQAQTTAQAPADFKMNTKALEAMSVGANLALMQSQTHKNESEAQSTDIENKYRDEQQLSMLLRQYKEITRIIADTDKASAEAKTLNDTRDSILQQYRLLANKYIADVDIAYQGIKESNSRIDVNEQGIKESNSRIAVNNQNIEESVSRVRNNHIGYNQALMDYGVQRDQIINMRKLLINHKLPPWIAPYLIDGLHNMSSQVGKDVPDLIKEITSNALDLKTWLNYLSSDNLIKLRRDLQENEHQFQYDMYETKEANHNNAHFMDYIDMIISKRR